MNGTISVPYRVKPVSGYVIVTFGTLFSAIALMTGFSSDSAFIDSVIIWGLATLFIGLAIYGLRLVRASRWADRQITLGDDHFTAPRSALNRQTVTVNYRDIFKIWWFPKYMGVRHTGGTLWITKACLQDTAAYETVYDRLKSQMPG